MKIRCKSRPVMIRMSEELKGDCSRIAEANGLTISDVVRLSVHRNLPDLKAGRLRLNPITEEVSR